MGREAKQEAQAEVSTMIAVEKPNLAMLRVERESAYDIARRFPRSEEKVLARALNELDLVPERGAKAIYDIPFKDRDKEGKEKIVHVVGLNIHSALDLRRLWGNNLAAVRISDENDDGADLEGLFIDLESNTLVSRPMRVSRFRKAYGKMTRTSDDRWPMAIGAAASKLLRNAILNGLPSWMTDVYFTRVKAIVAGAGKGELKATPDTMMKKLGDLCAWFRTRFGLTEEEILHFLDIPALAMGGEEEIVKLRGAWNAIKDGAATVEGMFRPGGPSPSGGPTDEGGGGEGPDAGALFGSDT